MAIDPRQFAAPVAGSGTATRNATIVRRSADLLRNSGSILTAPKILKQQVNATINNTVRRVPNRLKKAANNIAINTVSNAALGAFAGFQSGGVAGILSGGLSAGVGGILGDVQGAADGIIGQVGSDIGLGVGGAINNIGGGVFSGVGNKAIAGLKNLDSSSIMDALGSAGSTISGLFGGDSSINGEFVPISITNSDPSVTKLERLGIDVGVFGNCPPETIINMNIRSDDILTRASDAYANDSKLRQTDTTNMSQAQKDDYKAETDAQASQFLALDTEILAFKAETEKVGGECSSAKVVIETQRNPTHFASSLAKDHQPKYKFLFMVEFVFHPEYQHLMSSEGRLKSQFEFVVKNSTRPNVSFEHDEVNMYNYWTKVPKRTIYEPITMRFYDDIQNSASTFYTNYMRAMSPIANEGQDGNMVLPNHYQEHSLTQSVVSRTGTPNNTIGGASLGALNGDATNILLEIKLYHLYDWGKLLNVYHMYNPKITNLNLDDVDMAESGAGSELEIQFVYDGLYVEPARATTKELMAKISGAAVAPGYEIDPIFGDSDPTGNGPVPNGTTVVRSGNQAASPSNSPSQASANVVTPNITAGPTLALNTVAPPPVQSVVA